MQKSSSRNNSELEIPTQSSPRFRREILIHAQQLMHSLDLMEDQSDRFQNQDLPQFNAWYESKFTAERELISSLEQELSNETHFHNSMVAMSKMRNINLIEAYAEMREEEAAYMKANEARRRKIEEKRQARENFIRAEMENEFARHQNTIEILEPELEIADDDDHMKLVYRRLVRLLHPDMQGLQTDLAEARWQKRIWHLSQLARQRGDVAELDALYKVSLLRQMELSELTISDAHDIIAWLKRETDRVEEELCGYKTQAAWEFSLIGEHPGLEQRVIHEFQHERRFLEQELKDIRGQHAYLEVLSLTETPSPPARMKRRRERPKNEERDVQLSFDL